MASEHLINPQAGYTRDEIAKKLKGETLDPKPNKPPLITKPSDGFGMGGDDELQRALGLLQTDHFLNKI